MDQILLVDVLFGKEEGNLDNLLLLCTKVQEIWAVLFVIFGVNRVLPRSIRETLISWKGPFAGKTMKKIWTISPLCIFWTIWRERYRDIFEDVPSAQRMKNSFVHSLVLGQN